MSTNESIFVGSGVSFSYQETPAVAQFDLELRRGQIVSLLGPNGSGKSTLLKCLLGHLPATGEMRWQGRLIADWSRRELAHLLAYLPQAPTVDDSQTVWEVLQLGRAPYWPMFGIETTTDAAVVNRVIEQLSISRQLLRRRLDEISGGQRQNIFIARCLIQQPSVLLLDEPATFLDLAHQMRLLGLLRRLAHEQNLAVLLTCHDINLAGDFSDRLVLIAHGRKMADGPPTSILAPELLERIYNVKMERVRRSSGVAAILPVES